MTTTPSKLASRSNGVAAPCQQREPVTCALHTSTATTHDSACRPGKPTAESRLRAKIVPVDLPILAQWSRLRCAVDELDGQLQRARPPLPTTRMVRFLILAEDHRFARHPGVDPWALGRAAWKTYFCRSRQGGSTIAMQLVRTLSGRREHSWSRKALEIALAVRLSQYVSRDRLPVLYLWCAYYGWRMSNFQDACARLGLNPASTTPLDDALLIARLKYPQPKRQDHERLRKIHRRGLHILSLANVWRGQSYLPSFPEAKLL